ncbi:hypothetical protein C8A01DRAFT_21044, partial [Parachaetomium inaequale]
SFTERYMHTMASEVANAIARANPLGLGCLWTPDGGDGCKPYMAVFVLEDGGTPSQTSDMSDKATKAMTSKYLPLRLRVPRITAPRSMTNDLDRHVSFEVEAERLVGNTDGLIPQLRIRRWLPGWCFFSRVSRAHVIFSWARDPRRNLCSLG